MILYIQNTYTMRIIYLAIFSFCFLATGISQHNPVFSKVTATWCPNCGAWGWDYMEAMKDEFASGPALPLGVHHSGDLENETSSWWADNLNSSGQPVFFLNNERLSVGGSTWQDAVETHKAMADVLSVGDRGDFTIPVLYMDGDVITATIDIETIPTVPNRLNLGMYVYENNVENNQSQQGPNALHPNVLRASMSDEFQGQHIINHGTYDFTYTVDPTWNKDELGVLIVIWEEKSGTQEFVYSRFVDGISGLSSTDEILNSSDFTFADTEAALTISTENKETYQLSFTDMQGRQISSTSFQYETTISKSNLTSGMYIATLRSGNKVLSQQVFVR